MEPPVIIYKRPRLTNPSLIIGWADAGLVGTLAVDYLTDQLHAEELGEIEPYDFSTLPYSLIKGGVLQEVEYPGSSFHYWKNKKATGDLILFSSKPPDLNHYQMANLILDVAELFAVRRIYTVGGLYANTTHTEKPKVFAIINNSKLKTFLGYFDVEMGSDYHGPSSMNGLILGLAQQRNIDGISLWGQVPSYIGEIPNPRVSQTVLKVLTQLLAININFNQIEADARQTNKQIEEIVSYIRQQNPDLDQHIGKLEKELSVSISEEDRQKIFREIEEFLRRHKGRRQNGSPGS